MPYRQNILVIGTYTDTYTANFPVVPVFTLASLGGKLIAYDSENNLFPDTVRDTLFQPDNPFASTFIDRVLPYRSSDSF